MTGPSNLEHLVDLYNKDDSNFSALAEEALKKEREETLRVAILTLLGYHECSKCNYDRGIWFHKQARDVAEKLLAENPGSSAIQEIARLAREDVALAQRTWGTRNPTRPPVQPGLFSFA